MKEKFFSVVNYQTVIDRMESKLNSDPPQSDTANKFYHKVSL